MFSRVLAVLPLAVLAVANSHLNGRDQCSNGSAQCCQMLTTQQLAQQGYSKDVIAAVAATVQAVAGVQCSPITVIGAGSGCQVNQQAVCCTGDKFNGLVQLGCNNINV
ncbi:hypothetical protein SCLCIDRAFT_1212961 [Scleroderma citrinum Foug A]|uniref:Hydrophobin n=1 Tax=Scleroderma citrinum Foug A TaxID=1036808 RepID=A0A0C3E911_9AGAM|nr:hypothetical protein SCLCIDRAFT_1212961 [Scleroderma citrinum Foug A]